MFTALGASLKGQGSRQHLLRASCILQQRGLLGWASGSSNGQVHGEGHSLFLRRNLPTPLVSHSIWLRPLGWWQAGVLGQEAARGADQPGGHSSF